ncbi:biotin--[acetyl-CoA-carboxylase] ligase [Baaleninema simplex]|uniref:biotin--[acetyl-CoA-carboxylase] ligase n=1 Tax=Baaleninema simplex TaxID=2862350 RepID=UPI000347DF73|nr:biotin--[acetyl-CoA-carboxylase] ligase [Baaleninema simplex]
MKAIAPSIERIEAALAVLQETHEFTPSRLAIEVLDEVSSTNRLLWERVDGGSPSGTVLIAARQTAGRGQWSRQWDSSVGGLYLSAYWTVEVPTRYSGQLTLASAWGIATILRSRSIPVWLKWPNDVLLNGRKLGGILTETRLKGDRIAQAVVGVGINRCNPVPKLGINLQQFWHENPDVASFSLEFLAALVMLGIDRGLSQLRTQGIDRILPEYQQLLSHLNRAIDIDGLTGTIIGVAPNGYLRVRTRLGTHLQLPPGRVRIPYEEMRR